MFGRAMSMLRPPAKMMGLKGIKRPAVTSQVSRFQPRFKNTVKSTTSIIR